jgi:hypothetical protein
MLAFCSEKLAPHPPPEFGEPPLVSCLQPEVTPCCGYTSDALTFISHIYLYISSPNSKETYTVSVSNMF